MRVRLLLLTLLGMLCLPLSVVAQDLPPTAVVVTLPSAEGCDEIDLYLEQLRAVEEGEGGAEQLWSETFPGTTYVRQMSDDEFVSFYNGLPPEGLRNLADFYDRMAELTAAIEPPPVAAAVHLFQIEGMKLAATVWRDASYMGITTAIEIHTEEFDALSAIGEAQSQAVLSVCPAYQQVMEFDAE